MPNKDLIRKRIIWVLTEFPVVTPSMMIPAMGVQTPSRFWRPVLEEMIIEGVVVRDMVTVETPGGQHRTIAKIRLAELPQLQPAVA